MKSPAAIFSLCFTVLCASNTPALVEPRVEPSAPRSNWFVALKPLFLQAQPETGGRVRLVLDDFDTPGTDLSLLGGYGIDHEAHAPRATFGWR